MSRLSWKGQKGFGPQAVTLKHGILWLLLRLPPGVEEDLRHFHEGIRPSTEKEG